MATGDLAATGMSAADIANLIGLVSPPGSSTKNVGEQDSTSTKGPTKSSTTVDPSSIITDIGGSSSTTNIGASNTVTNIGGSTSNRTVGPSSSTTITQDHVDEAGVNRAIQQILEGSQGLAATAAGQHISGGYNNTTDMLLKNDLAVRTAGTVSLLNKSVTSTTNNSGYSDTTVNSGSQNQVINSGSKNQVTNSGSQNVQSNSGTKSNTATDAVVDTVKNAPYNISNTQVAQVSGKVAAGIAAGSLIYNALGQLVTKAGNKLVDSVTGNLLNGGAGSASLFPGGSGITDGVLNGVIADNAAASAASGAAAGENAAGIISGIGSGELGGGISAGAGSVAIGSGAEAGVGAASGAFESGFVASDVGGAAAGADLSSIGAAGPWGAMALYGGLDALSDSDASTEVKYADWIGGLGTGNIVEGIQNGNIYDTLGPASGLGEKIADAIPGGHALDWIICTELCKQNRLNKRWYFAGAKTFSSYSDISKIGYYIWAIPCVTHLRKYPNSYLSKFLEYIFNWRAEYIAHTTEVKGARKLKKGMLVSAILYPTCCILGHVLHFFGVRKDYKVVYSAENTGGKCNGN